jgi:hypothetical protein
MKHRRQRDALWLLPVGALLYSAAAWAFKCTPPAETTYELTLIDSDDEDWSDSAMALASENQISLWGYSESDPQLEIVANVP